MIRLSVHVELLLGRYAKGQEQLTQALGRTPKAAEMAGALNTTEEQVDELVPETSADPTQALVSLFSESADLAPVIDDLAENECCVLCRRFHLEGEPRQIEGAGLRKLRAPAREGRGSGGFVLGSRARGARSRPPGRGCWRRSRAFTSMNASK